MAAYDSEPRAWVRMPSQRRLNLLDPTPFDWEDADLALGLARTYRWGGHSAWPRPLSVAQHSLTVMVLARQAWSGPPDPLLELRELLHDAEEGLLGFDCISPLKPFLGEGFRELTLRLERAVFLRYGLPAWTPEQHLRHKRADHLAAASEAVHVVGWSEAEVAKILRIDARALQDDPLRQLYDDAEWTCWEPWPPALACQRFLAQLQLLTDKIQEGEQSP